MSGPPSDRELVEALREQADGRRVVDVARRPYRYATSAPLEEVRMRLDDGAEIVLILKDLARERRLGDARASKPPFLDEPRRELETYRRILSPAGIGARCMGGFAGDDPPRYWLLIEKVPGVELWQVGDLAVWEGVATWLGDLHDRCAPRVDELRAANPYLLELSDTWFRSWGERAGTALAGSADGRAPQLRAALDRYEEVVAPLAALAPTFVHGELYPSNVLVVTDHRPPRVCPIDWEMAAIGPALVDLAALVGGWADAERDRLIAAYVGGRSRGGRDAPDALAGDLARCRLHLALQWLGWSPDWSPPAEHAHDWLGEALGLVRELGLA